MKLPKILFLFLFLSLFFLLSFRNVYAEISWTISPNPVTEADLTFQVTFKNLSPSTKYVLNGGNNPGGSKIVVSSDGQGNLTTPAFCAANNLQLKTSCDPNHDYFHGGETYVASAEPEKDFGSGENITTVNVPITTIKPSVAVSPSAPTSKDTLSVILSGPRLPYSGSSGSKRNNYSIKIYDGSSKQIGNTICGLVIPSGSANFSLGPFSNGSYTLQVFGNGVDSNCNGGSEIESVPFTISDSGGTIGTNPGNGTNTPVNTNPNDNGNTSIPPNDNGSSEVGKPIKTGLGNIPTQPDQLVNAILRIFMGIAGGIAFLLIIYGGFRLAFSQGDPKAVQEGREIITSAIIGLVLIIMAVFLLRLIGIDILGLPI